MDITILGNKVQLYTAHSIPPQHSQKRTLIEDCKITKRGGTGSGRFEHQKRNSHEEKWQSDP